VEPAKETGSRFEDEERGRADIRDGLSVLRSAAFGLNGGVALELADERRVRLERLGGGDAANLDIKALTGRSPWLRVRVGDWRVIYRPADPGPGWYVARVVNRRDFDATVKQL
jgi:mRNA-degrading endonuclease RelE of RelBE toxin-antitoxin system